MREMKVRDSLKRDQWKMQQKTAGLEMQIWKCRIGNTKVRKCSKCEHLLRCSNFNPAKQDSSLLVTHMSY